MKSAIYTRYRAGFTLVEIMIVVAIIALLALIAIPGAQRARKRSQAARTIEELRQIEYAVDQWAIENGKVAGDTVSFDEAKKYLKPGTILYNTSNDCLGNTFGSAFAVDTLPRVNDAKYKALSDVTGPEFWSPYH